MTRAHRELAVMLMTLAVAGCRSKPGDATDDAPRSATPAASSELTVKPSPAPQAHDEFSWMDDLPSAQRPKKVDYSNLSADDLSVTLQRTVCYGRCPVYAVSLRGDGRVCFDGEMFVKQCGKASGKVPKKDVAALLEHLKKMDWFGLRWTRSCEAGRSTDAPSVKTVVRVGAYQREIGNYHGDRCIPDAVREMEDRIDAVAQTTQWVRCPSDSCGLCPDPRPSPTVGKVDVSCLSPH